MRISSLRYENLTAAEDLAGSPRKCGKYIKSKNSDLCSFSGMVKHVEPGNMSRGMKKYIPLFCYCYQLPIVSTPHPAPITIKAATDVSDSEYLILLNFRGFLNSRFSRF